MTDSLINTHTAGAVAEITQLVEPTNDVSGSGGGDVFTNADTAKIVAAGSIVKYVNLTFEAGVLVGSLPSFYEYAVVMFTEQEAAPTVNALIDSNRATKMLGEICRNLYREKCIWFGSLGSNLSQTQVMNLAIKIPEKFCKWKNGQYLSLIGLSRPANTTDSTSLFQVNTLCSFKCYN